MAFFSPLTGSLKKQQSGSQFASVHQPPRKDMAEYINKGSDAMDWQDLQALTSTNQAISQLRIDLRADWERSFTSYISKMNAEHQQCQQATLNNIKDTVRMVLEEWFANSQMKPQSPRDDAAPESSQSLNTEAPLMTPDSEDCAQVGQLTQKLEMAELELADLKKQLKAAQLRTDQLRSMIIPADENPVLDSEIETLFSEVRAKTQYVARGLYTNPGSLENATTKEGQALFKAIEGLDRELQQDAVHLFIFLDIRRQYFPNNLQRCNIRRHYPALQEVLATTERHLSEAMRDTWLDGTGKKELAAWSRATFSCIDLLKDESDEPGSYALYIEQTLKEAETNNMRLKERGKKNLRELCEKAHKLGILMRRAKDTFQTFTVKHDTPLADYEYTAQELRFNERGGTVGTKVIDSCLFGGLRKISIEYPDEFIVLQKVMVSTRFVTSTE
ncbi:hypothetical protein FCIRC_2997 [Fusarium circinatum]|uniref:Uncharacterized protein n=1 Tax=Fusarium circinatum TaxID=48490 RepID=A0A8H5UFJ1_FUSCI|nr:hypothetical protein FCIRC_2997 [Fusarium circinatum]